MKLQRIAIFIISFSFLLISCNTQYRVSQTPTQTANPTITNLPKPTSTRKATITPSPTLSQAQETATAVHIKVEEMSQTQEHFMFTALPATLKARGVKCRNGFVLEREIELLRYSNDDWTLFTCSPVSKNKTEQWTPGVVDYGTRYTQITKTDLSQTWIIQHNTFDYSRINRPDAWMLPFRWTADGKYLYLYPQYYPDGSGAFPNSEYLRTCINDLYRINLETGKFELAIKKDQFGALGLSPDDQSLVYSEPDRPHIIHVRSMESDKDLQVKLNTEIVVSGSFVWNPEGTKVVFAVAYGKKSDERRDDISSTSIFVLTPRCMHAQMILAEDTRLLIPWSCEDKIWLDANTIYLRALSDKFAEGENIFTIDIQSGSVKKFSTPAPEFNATSTSTPQP